MQEFELQAKKHNCIRLEVPVALGDYLSQTRLVCSLARNRNFVYNENEVL